ncbi:reactive intermediate/imine deaminase [Planctomycetales bacterium]|nr:reactive intermediate/imine deaminase [Planctomycetales bacterium]GHV23950.1 reactive intermediate/imine deaminase [Planctomycetales bacterium]
MKKAIYPADASTTVGPYSPAVEVDNRTLYVSGQIPLDPQTGKIVGDDIVGQTEQVFRRLNAVLAAGGYTLADVVKATVFLTDMNDFAAMNEVYGRHLASACLPARSAFQVAQLPRGVKIEIEVVAMK